MKMTMHGLHEKKRLHRKITMLTCYDYPTAVLQDKAKLDVIFVGDSLGTNELGYAHETSVTLEEILHHLRAVRRGVREAYLLADLPYRTYEDPEMALHSAKQLLLHGADGVKLEGMQEDVVARLAAEGIEVWGHLGYNPQWHEKIAVQGKTFESAKALVEGAAALQNAGACMLVLELVPEPLGQLITQALTIPTIGIGAGRYTDGQVLIVQDMLGITPREIRHAKAFAPIGSLMLRAFEDYVQEVQAGEFPEPVHARKMPEEELQALRMWRESNR